MAVSTVPAAIASIVNGVTATVNGVTLTVKGIDPPPAQLSTAKLPCAYVLIGDAQYDVSRYGADEIYETRNYRVQCVVEAHEQTSRETRELWTRALIAAVRNRLLRYPSLGTTGVLNAYPTSDTGPVTIQDTPNTEYVGFEITVQCNEIIARTYATGE